MRTHLNKALIVAKCMADSHATWPHHAKITLKFFCHCHTKHSPKQLAHLTVDITVEFYAYLFSSSLTCNSAFINSGMIILERKGHKCQFDDFEYDEFN